MSLLNLARKKKKDVVVAEVQAACQHWDLAPRWNSAADMGKEELITHYVCCACGDRVCKDVATNKF